jgi:hypothetical protein
MDVNTVLTLVSFTAGFIVFLGSLVWWLSTQFAGVRKLCYEIKDQVLDKLDYHEKHDDERFNSLSKDIWEIRVRNASLDGRHIPKQSNGVNP